MAGTIDLKQLLLNKFVEFNLTRYADDPEMLPLFQGLTLDEVTISDLVTGVAEPQMATISSTSRNFRGLQQEWLPAFINSRHAFTALNEATPLVDEAALADQTVPGVYLYTSGADVLPGLVLPHDTVPATLEANAISVFQGGYKYVIGDEELTVDDTTLSIALNPYTRGSLVHVTASVAVVEIPATDYGRLEYPEA